VQVPKFRTENSKLVLGTLRIARMAGHAALVTSREVKPVENEAIRIVDRCGQPHVELVAKSSELGDSEGRTTLPARFIRLADLDGPHVTGIVHYELAPEGAAQAACPASSQASP
jgi:hypothetical protein